MVTATALYAFYTPVTAVDRPEACLRRNESPAATLTTTLTPCVLSDSQDRSIIDLRIAICHTCSDRSILDLRMACGTHRVLVDLLNAALCPERV